MRTKNDVGVCHKLVRLVAGISPIGLYQHSSLNCYKKNSIVNISTAKGAQVHIHFTSMHIYFYLSTKKTHLIRNIFWHGRRFFCNTRVCILLQERNYLQKHKSINIYTYSVIHTLINKWYQKQSSSKGNSLKKKNQLFPILINFIVTP